MNQSALPFKIEVLLSLQQAMWDEVLPTLRAVAVNAHYPKISARFIYEILSEKEYWITNDIETLVIADFAPDVSVECVPVQIPGDSSRVLLDGEQWVYMRYEESSAGPII